MSSSIPPSQTSRSTSNLSQQSTLAGGNGANPGGALQQALGRFKKRLTGTNLTEFQLTTFEQLRDEVQRIQREQDANKSLMNLSRIQSCLEAMHQFGKVIEVFLNCSDVVAFVWGPVKFLLLTASNWADSFETLLEAYERIGEQLPLLVEYESLFHHCPHMIDALELMYIDILEFHLHAIKFFSGKNWTRFFKSMWKNFGTKFDGILRSLGRHKDLVESRASVAQYRIYRDDIAELKLKLDKSVNQEKEAMMKKVKEWLVADQGRKEGLEWENDHDTHCQARRDHPLTAQWILGHEFVKDWMESDVPSTPILWLTGIPGAGKTILASAIIEECKKSSTYLTAFYYCRDDDPERNTAVEILKGLIYQLLDQHTDLLSTCHTRCSSSGEPLLRTLNKAKKLLEDFCVGVPKIALIIDGLDEYESAQRRQLLQNLMDLIGHCDTSDPGSLRVMFVSQHLADMKNSLTSSGNTRIAPKTIQLTSVDVEGDIDIYVRFWVNRLADHFSFSNPDEREYIRNLIVKNANGMFLYAELVMIYLNDQDTQAEFIHALKSDFPPNLKKAYEKILNRIQNDPIKWKKAKQLLGWMVCAKRRLTLREIQVAHSINVENQTIDYKERHLRTDIRDICGPLVLISGDRVSLMHSTAKKYITEIPDGIHKPSVECDLAALCLEYLTFPCFDPDEDIGKQELRKLALEGHFAFQDYAVAKWFYHINAFVNAGAEFLSRGKDLESRIENITTALENFLERYEEEEWETVVKQCKETCRAFEDCSFYQHLIELTSHIYKFQEKGFDARHKISIKGLASAFERNRKLLEELPDEIKKFPNERGKRELKEYCEFYDDVRRFKCSKITCMYFSQGFKDGHSRNKHVRSHERPFHCDVPDCLGAEGFANSTDLDKHIRSFHPEISDLAKTFNSAIEKKGVAKHACTICGKTFTRNFHKTNHEKSHRGEREHECPECGKAFTRKNDCKRHQKLHDRR